MGIAAFIYAALVILMIAFQDRLLFMPDTKYYSLSDVGTDAYTEITVTTSDNLALKGWYAPAHPNKPTLLFFQGNASTWQWRARDFESLITKGYGILLAGYRGYGGNTGKPSEAGFYTDAEAYLGALASANIKPQDIVLYGESLGTGVAIEMAYRHKNIGGLVLEAPYASIAKTAAIHYPFVPFIERLVHNKFESLYKVGAITAPKLFLLAANDRTIPPSEGAQLFEYANKPKAVKIIPHAGHNDIRSMGGLTHLEAFLISINN